MKKLLLLSLSSLLAGLLFSQAPAAFNYQAVLRDASGNLQRNTNATLRFTILRGGTGGSPLYSETQAATTNLFAMVDLAIGRGNALFGRLDTIDWSSNSYYLTVEVQINNTGSFLNMGTNQLISVPYAKYADNTGPLNQSSANYYGRGYIFIDPTDTSYQSIAGLDTTINVPANCTTLFSTTGTMYGTGFSSLATERVTLFIDGQAPVKGGTQVLWIVTDNNTSGGGANWTINYPVQLSPGLHTVQVQVESTNPSNQCSVTVDNGGFFDNSVLTVTFLRN